MLNTGNVLSQVIQKVYMYKKDEQMCIRQEKIKVKKIIWS